MEWYSYSTLSFYDLGVCGGEMFWCCGEPKWSWFVVQMCLLVPDFWTIKGSRRAWVRCRMIINVLNVVVGVERVER